MIEADKFFIINDDPDLKPFKVDIEYIIRRNFEFWNPEYKGVPPITNPNPKKIDGYNLSKYDQYFRRSEVPIKLEQLEKKHQGDQILIWKEISQNRSQYKSEITWIKKQIYHILYGYWFMNNGKPTYIDGWHYGFLNFYQGSYSERDKVTKKVKNSKHPEYRDRDRRKFLYFKYGLITNQTWKHLDSDGFALPNAEGQYEMIEKEEKTCFGIAYPKHRRDGATNNVLNCIYLLLIYVQGGYSSIIANHENTGEEHWNIKFVPMWRKMPFFLKPLNNGDLVPKTSLDFSRPGRKLTPEETKEYEDELGGTIDYKKTTKRSIFDQAKITAGVLLDEGGKTTSEDIYLGWFTVKPAMTLGANSIINKFATTFHPSSVEEMESGAANNFKLMCDGSNPYQRNPLNGQTDTGLLLLFIPAYDGLENFIGKYGESIIDRPTKEQADWIGRQYGAKQYIEITLEQIRKKNTADSLKQYEKFRRQHPQQYEDIWRLEGTDLGFNQEAMDNCISRLKRETKCIRGDFKWLLDIKPDPISAEEFILLKLHKTDVDKRGKVIFVPSDNGLWNISKQLLEGEFSNRVWNRFKGYFEPKDSGKYYTGCADPFQYMSKIDAQRREDRRTYSYGASTIFWELDERVDDKYGDSEHWKSYRFVADLMTKVTNEDIFAEETLMSCIYFNALMYPEINIKLIWKHFEDRGYYGYLKYGYDQSKLTHKTQPGFNNSAMGGIRDELFTCVQKYIENHFHRHEHIEIAKQFKGIKAREETKKFDLFIASAGALHGSDATYRPTDTEHFNKKKTNYIDETETVDFWYGKAR